MKIEDIKEISYDYQKEVMIVTLYEKINYKGYIRDYVSFKCDEKTFIEKSIKLIEFKNNSKKI